MYIEHQRSSEEIQALYWRAVDVWALGIILYSMIFHKFPPWNRKVDPQRGQIATVATDVNDRTFHIVCRHGRLGELLSKNGINAPEDFVDLLQNILRENPRHRLTTEAILNHPWLV